MKVNSRYGVLESPRVVTVASKTRCFLCDGTTSAAIEEGQVSREDADSVYLKKGDKAVQLVFNTGPTGIGFLCHRHARELGDALLRVSN